MAKVEFEVEDDLTAVAGIALVSCYDREGKPITAILDYGDMRAIEAIGLLATTLDQYRYNYLDRNTNIFEEDE